MKKRFIRKVMILSLVDSDSAPPAAKLKEFVKIAKVLITPMMCLK